MCCVYEYWQAIFPYDCIGCHESDRTFRSQRQMPQAFEEHISKTKRWKKSYCVVSQEIFMSISLDAGNWKSIIRPQSHGTTHSLQPQVLHFSRVKLVLFIQQEEQPYTPYIAEIHRGSFLATKRENKQSLGTYHVQTNLYMKTMQTLIWIIGFGGPD